MEQRHGPKQTLHFWYDFASSYSYLSAMRLSKLASRADVEIIWQPFLLGPIFADQGWSTSPFNIYPAKGRYMWRDMQRICKIRDLPLRQLETFPQNGLTAARLALLARDLGKVEDFTKAVFTAQFALGQNIFETEVLRSCLTMAELPENLLQATQDASLKQRLRDQVEKARYLDLFGAPSFVVEHELFWGDDRLEQALTFAAKSPHDQT